MKFLLLLSIAFLACNCDITIDLSDVYVEEGNDAVFPCKFNSDQSGDTTDATISWFLVKDGNKQLLYRVNPANPSATVDRTGDVEGNIYVSDNGTLSLLSTKLIDNENYKTFACEVERNQEFASASADLHVFLLPGDQPVVETLKAVFNAGSKKSVGTCVSGGYGYPVPTVTFYRGNNPIETTNSDDDFFELTEDKLADPGPWKSEKIQMTLITNLTRDDNGVSFYCIVESGKKGTGIYRRQNATMPSFNVAYPTDKVEFVNPPETVYAGATMDLKCKGNGYPSPKITIGGKKGETLMVDVTKSKDGEVYTCKGTNSKSMEESSFVDATYTMNVLYADDLTVEGDTTLDYGKPISLECVSNSKPKSSGVYWTKNGETVSSSAVLTISNASFSDAGMYICMAPNQHEALKRSKNVEVIIEGLKLREKSVIVSDEQATSITLTCDANAYPEPSFSWTRMTPGKEEVEPVTGAELKSLGNHQYQSVLKLGALTSELSKATYTCEVTSGEKPPQKTVFELPEKKPGNDDGDSEAMVATSSAGIIIGILVAIIVIAIILAVLYNKGIICNKKEDDGEEDAKDIAMQINRDEEAAVPETNGDSRPNDFKQQREEEVGEDTELINGEQNS